MALKKGQKIKKTTDKTKILVASLIKSGKCYRDIVQITGKSLGTITNIAQAYSEELQNMKEATEIKIKEKIAEFTPSDRDVAIQVHRKVMKMVDSKPAIALQAAEKTLDRIEGKPIQRTLNENINLDIDSSKLQKMLSDKGFSRVLDNL